jgi:ABC-type antimicrobial peptide transport system permease subunit
MLTYAVVTRTREIGIRVAFGATLRMIAALILREAVVSAGAGLALGFVFYYFFSRATASLVFGVSTWDPVSILCTATAVVIAVTVASLIPALRAASIQPSTALRNE